MKLKILQFIIVIGILTCFFLPMFNVEEKVLTGFEAILSNEILLFGNIIISVVFLMSALHFILMVLASFRSEKSESLEEVTNIIVNIGLISGLLMVTFLGWQINAIAIMCVALMIATAYIRYKFLA